MNILVEFIKDSLVTALAGYGLVTMMTLIFPSLGPASNLWLVVPVTFVIQFGLNFFQPGRKWASEKRLSLLTIRKFLFCDQNSDHR